MEETTRMEDMIYRASTAGFNLDIARDFVKEHGTEVLQLVLDLLDRGYSKEWLLSAAKMFEPYLFKLLLLLLHGGTDPEIKYAVGRGDHPIIAQLIRKMIEHSPEIMNALLKILPQILASR